MKYSCDLCWKEFNTYENMRKHLVEYHRIHEDSLLYKLFDLVNVTLEKDEIIALEEYLNTIVSGEITLIEIDFKSDLLILGIVCNGNYKEIGEFLDNLKKKGWLIEIEKDGYIYYWGRVTYGMQIRLYRHFDSFRREFEKIIKIKRGDTNVDNL